MNMIISAALMMSAVSSPGIGFGGESTYRVSARSLRRRPQNQSPDAQRARKIRKKKRVHAKRYNRHYTPKMST